MKSLGSISLSCDKRVKAVNKTQTVYLKLEMHDADLSCKNRNETWDEYTQSKDTQTSFRIICILHSILCKVSFCLKVSGFWRLCILSYGQVAVLPRNTSNNNAYFIDFKFDIIW